MGPAVAHPNGLSLALGTDEVTLNDLVLAYTPLATGGAPGPRRGSSAVYDRKAHTWTESPRPSAPGLAPAAAFVTTQMLKDVMTYGTAKSLRKFSQSRPSAGKTGTTDDYPRRLVHRVYTPAHHRRLGRL